MYTWRNTPPHLLEQESRNAHLFALDHARGGPRPALTLEVERTDTGERTRLSCGFLLLCAGYYRYDRGHEPDFVDAERFGGRVVHPQHWPEDLDYAGRRVVVIGILRVFGMHTGRVDPTPARRRQLAHAP